jgi:hypothetical protein
VRTRQRLAGIARSLIRHVRPEALTGVASPKWRMMRPRVPARTTTRRAGTPNARRNRFARTGDEWAGRTPEDVLRARRGLRARWVAGRSDRLRNPGVATWRIGPDRRDLAREVGHDELAPRSVAVLLVDRRVAALGTPAHHVKMRRTGAVRASPAHTATTMTSTGPGRA